MSVIGVFINLDKGCRLFNANYRGDHPRLNFIRNTIISTKRNFAWIIYSFRCHVFPSLQLLTPYGVDLALTIAAADHNPCVHTGSTIVMGPRIGMTGAMSASRGPCTLARFVVWHGWFDGSPPVSSGGKELSWLLQPKHVTTPVISNNRSRIDVYISRKRGFDV